MLEITGFNQYYGESRTLWDVSINVPKGSCVCLMGRNGVGKTTLLKSIMGLVPIESGAIKFEGRDITAMPTQKRARLGIGYVPQGREIFPLLTVEENLQLGLAASRNGMKEIPELVFNLFPALKKMMRRRGGDLSGGQQQQLAIGRALVAEPSLLILDEPTEGIQPNIVREIGDIIIRLNKEQNLTVLLVEQKLPFARRVAQRFSIMEKGRAVSEGAMSELSDELINRHLKV